MKKICFSRLLLQELNQTVGLQTSFFSTTVSELLQNKAISVEVNQAVKADLLPDGSDSSSSEGKDYSNLFVFV